MIPLLRAIMVGLGAGLGIVAARFAADKLIGQDPDPEGFAEVQRWEQRYQAWKAKNGMKDEKDEKTTEKTAMKKAEEN